jgi:hypothetical protein
MPRYTYNGKTYNVPDDRVEGFLSRKPSAKPLEASSPVMTSVGIGTSLTAPAKTGNLTLRESDILKSTDTTVAGNQPAGVYSPESALPALKMPSVGPVDTTFTSPAEFFAPKSNEAVVIGALRNDLAAHMADPAVRFERELQVYRDSGEYERDKSKELGEQSLPAIAHDYLERIKPHRDRSKGVLTEMMSGERTERKATEQEQADLVNRFLANDSNGQRYAAEYAGQVKWLDDQIVALEAKIGDSEKNAPRVKRDIVVGGASTYGIPSNIVTVNAPENFQDTEAARTQLSELKSLQKAVADGDRSAWTQFWNEMGRRSGAGVMNIATLGISEPLTQAGVNRALQDPDNELTKEATDLLGQWQSLHANDRSIAQDIANGTYGSLAFMAQYAVTGGAASALTKGASTVIASKLGSSVAAKAVGKMGQTVGDAFVRTALSPSTLAGAYELNTQNPGSFLDAYSQKFTQNLVEYASEGMGAVMPGAKIFGGAKTSLGRALGKVSEYTGVQDVGTEFLEEQLATLWHAATGDGQGSWADFVDPRSQLVTLGSVALMQLPNVMISAGGYAAGKAHNVVQTRSIRKGYNDNLKNLNFVLGKNAAEIVGVVNEQVDGSPDTAIPSLIDALASDNEMYDAQKDAIMKYALSRAAMSGLEKAKTEEVEAITQRVAPLIEENLNTDMGAVVSIKVSGVDTPVQSVSGRIVQHEDGTIDDKKSDAHIFYTDPEGKRKVIAIEHVEGVSENIPRDEAVNQITEMATAPIIAKQQNNEVRTYEVGEMVRASANGGSVIGHISGIDATGNYILDVETPNGMAQMSVEPRQIVNEDNLRGVENGSEVLYIDENGNQVEGVAVMNPDLYMQGLIGLENGDAVPIADVVGLASEWVEQATADEQGIAPETTEVGPQSLPVTDGAAQTEQEAEQSTSQGAAQPFTPRTFEIDKNVTATSNHDGTYSLNTRYAKSELKKADALVKKLNEDYSDNGMVFETVQLPRVDATNPFEKPMWGILARITPSAPAVETAGSTVVEAAGAIVESSLEPQKPKKLTLRQKFATNTIPANLREAALLYMMGGGKLNRREFMARTGYGPRDLGTAFKVLSNNGVPFDTFESDFYATYRPSEYEVSFESNLDEITQAVKDYIEDGGRTDDLKQRFGRDAEIYDPDGEARAEYEVMQAKNALGFENEILDQQNEEIINNLINFAQSLGISQTKVGETLLATDVVSLLQQYEDGRNTIDSRSIDERAGTERNTSDGSEVYAGRDGAYEGSSDVPIQETAVYGQTAGATDSGERREQDSRSGIPDSSSRGDDARGLRTPALSEAEQRITDEAGAAFDAEVAEVETRLRNKRAEFSAAKARIGAAYTADNQTSLFPQEQTPATGNLFDVPRDYSRGNVEDILVPIQQEIDALTEHVTALQGQRESRVQAALDNFRSQLTLEDAIARAESETDTNPTEAQIQAGNYKKGHVSIQGFNISIENPKGSVRSGVDENGHEWSQEMRNTYGYIGKTQSKDGDHIDVFLGDNPESGTLFVVDQVNPATGQFDEHKVMLGFDSAEEARDAYFSNYEEGWQGMGDITAVDVETFRGWAQSEGRRVKPFAEYKSVQSAQLQSTANHFKPISTSEFNDLIDRLRQTGLAKDIITDPARMREVLMEVFGDRDAARFLSLWHGSPATFKKFSSAFIGTGEGAQAFGYGLYFTSRRDIAKWYADKLKPSKFRENAIINDLARETIEDHDGDTKAALAHEKWVLEQDWSDKKRIRAVIKILETGKFLSEGKSNIYEVEVGDELNFMQWNEPVPESQIASIGRQAKKEGLVDKWGHKVTYVDPIPFSNEATGERVYNQLAKEYFNDSPAEVSAFLERAGINGVRYPAASSSATVKDRSGDNYVVFDDSAIQIIGKVRMMATPTGDVYGFVTPDGTVYLDSSRMNANTPIHEFGHLWNSFVKDSNPELWARGSALIRQSEYWAKVNDNPAYNTLSDDRKVDEALAMTIGDKGEVAFLRGDVVAYAGVKGWIWQAWEWIKSKLGIARGTNIEDMTLGDFTDLAVRQLLGGKKLQNSSETPIFVNENDSENGTRTETSMDNRRAMGGSAFRKALGDTETGRRIHRTVEAADLGGIDRTVREAEELEELKSRGVSPNFSKPNFRKALIEAAKENGVWLENSYLDGKELMHDQRAHGTSENDVYRNPEGGTLTKLNNLSYVTGVEHTRNLAALVDRIVAHNEVFPNVAYEIKGFTTNKNGLPALVMEQPEVDTERNATQEEIDEYLTSIGFELSGTRGWSNEHSVWSNGTYELFDARPANVLMGRDGNLYFIDTIPHLIEYMNGQSSGPVSRQEVSEMEQIKARAITDGTFMKASNGKSTNLTERQWLQVRTTNFKNWFGDWEKTARIEKLRESVPVEITGEEYVGKYELNRDSAKRYIKDSLRGEYANKDTGDTIVIVRGGANKVTSHGMSDQAHLKSIAAIPTLIDNAVFIEERNNEKSNDKFDSYRYYVVGLKIGSVDYTAKLTVGVKQGKRYYDHALTQIEKGSLIETANSFTTTGDAPNPSYAEVKDTKLISILQTNSSKIVDENGEPRIMYHGTTARFTEFKEDVLEIPVGFWFASDKKVAQGHGRVKSVFINSKQPTDDYEQRDNYYVGNGFDGLIYNYGSGFNVNVMNPNQIKSATKNTGEFNPDNADIRFQSVGDVARATGSAMTEAMRNELDAKLKKTSFRLQEAWVDRHLAVKKFLDKLREQGVNIPDYNDFYLQATHLSGKIDANWEAYKKTYNKAIGKAIFAIRDINGDNISFREIENYVMLKHGFERNDWMRQNAIDKYMEANPDATPEQIAEFESNLPKDYSGITAIEAEIETTSGIWVSEFERKVGQEKIDALWRAINNATRFALKTRLDAGLMTKAEFDEYTARYKYYVPLRGHDAETAEDRYDYGASMGTYFVAPLISAKGRKSRAESPFAFIHQMAHSEISAANTNVLNQTMLRLAFKDKTGLMSVSKAWYVKSGYDAKGNPLYEVQSPEYSEDAEQYRKNIESFEQRMEYLAEKGDAYKGRRKLNLGGLFIKPSQAIQHEVHVYQNGEEYVIYINADPAIARAINGTNMVQNGKEGAFIRNVSRNMAANFTTRNPLFTISNFERDYGYSTRILMVKEGMKYALQFQSNVPLSMGALQRYVSDKMDLSREEDVYLNEFIMNGGKTGYSHFLELQRVQRQIERDTKKFGQKKALERAGGAINAIVNGLQAMNDVAENTTRLATFITSRKAGRSLIQSIDDAKNVTVNFNKTGTGAWGNRYFCNLYLFTNASVQALANNLRVTKAHPGRMALLVAERALWGGWFTPLLALLLGGDDGEEEYWRLPDWDRQNNLCIYTGKGFIKVALSHELRVYYKIGDEFGQAIRGRKDWGEAIGASILGLSDLLPLDPAGSANTTLKDFREKNFSEGAATLLSLIAPDYLSAGAEIIANRSFSGGRIINEWADPDLPGYKQARTNLKGEAYAPSFLVDFSKWANDVTGGDSVKKGWSGFGLGLDNPDIINHVMNSYFGGLYKMASQAIDVAYKGIGWTQTGEFELKVRETPLRQFFTSSDDLQTASSGLVSRYLSVSDDVKEILRQVNGYNKEWLTGEMTPEEAGDKLKKLDIQRATRVNGLIKYVNKIKGSLKELDGEQQKAAERMMYDFQQQAVDMYREK